LRQRPTAGRAAVVFPNGVLFGDNACAKIKEDLLKEYNLHTIVRLPNGVFAPYTGIPTNILFFDRSQPTNEIWYYEIPLPEGRKNYTKTKPIQDEAFAECLAWWHNREENQQAWKYDFRAAYHQAKTEAEVFWAQGEQAKGDAIYWAIYNLDKKNPNSQSDFEHLPPEQLVADILEKDRRVAEIMAEIKEFLGN
jgi:type I restriction enzyme M protein